MPKLDNLVEKSISRLADSRLTTKPKLKKDLKYSRARPTIQFKKYRRNLRP